MSNENCNIPLHIYAEGKNPSGRDIQNLCAMIETCVVLSVFNLSGKSEENFSFYKIDREYKEYLKEKYFSHIQGVAPSIDRLTNLVLATTMRAPYFDLDMQKEKYMRKEMRFFEEDIHHLRHELHRATKDFRDPEEQIDKLSLRAAPRINDFNEWVSIKYGNRILDTQSIETTNSIELLFNLVAIGGILGFQHVPEIKDIAVFSVQMFKDWMGKSKQNNNSEIKVPSLPASMERTIAKFNEVELEQDSNGWSIKLKR